MDVVVLHLHGYARGGARECGEFGAAALSLLAFPVRVAESSSGRRAPAHAARTYTVGSLSEYCGVEKILLQKTTYF